MNKATILVGLQFIENPKKILEESLKVAKKYQAKIYIMHVIEEMPRASFYYDAYKIWEDFRDKAVKETLGEMNKYIKELSHDFDDIEPIIEVGNPVDKIVEEAEKLEVDLIIVGHHVRTTFQHLLHHNIGEKIMRLSKRPVLSFYIEN
ncbi:MAG: universal stress protein [bacterium]|nr:universal stress protein [bacterium]